MRGGGPEEALGVGNSRSRIFVAGALSVRAASLCRRSPLGVRVHAGANLAKVELAREEERGERRRNGAGDNNHNNLVKRYKDISR